MKEKFITIILSIILFIIPIAIIPDIWGPYNLPKIIILLICGLLLLFCTTISIGKIHFDKTDITILIFGGLAILSTIFSQNVYMSLLGANNRFEGIFTIITYILIYYNSKYFFRKYKNFTNIISIIYMLICVLGIVQFYVKAKIVLPPIFSKGVAGTFGHSNFMGSFVSIIVPFFILGSILKNKKIYYLGSILGFSAMIMCTARSSWVAFVVSSLTLIIYLILKKNKKYWKRFFVLLILFALCFTGINMSDKNKKITKQINVVQSEIKTATQTGINKRMGSSRIQIWKACFKLIKQLPILGCGVDALQVGLNLYAPEEYKEFIEMTNSYIDKAHNEYLHIASTMGIPALITYLTFICMIVFPGIKKMLKHNVTAIYVIVIISYLSQAFFNISTIGIAPIFWFILGLASRSINHEKIKQYNKLIKNY